MNYNKADFLISVGKSSELPVSDKPEICFSGRSNVGKSTLINKVLGRKSIARVSTKPGKTVTINYFGLENIYLVDLPGYGYAKVSASEKDRWSELMNGYFESDRNIRMVFQLIDMRHLPTKFDIQMLEYLTANGFDFTVVLTKSDKLNKSEYKKSLEQITAEVRKINENVNIIPFSSMNSEGVEDIRGVIEKIAGE